LKRTTRAAWAGELLKAASVVKPLGAGPFPVVFQLHGCGGPRPFIAGYTQAALGVGAAVVTVDSFKPRGLNRLSGSCLVCTGLMLKGAQRAADVYALYDWAQRQPWIDARRIAFAGWSHGAWTIMDALAMGPRAARHTGLTDLPAEPLQGLAAAVLVYPYAAYPAMTIPHGWGGAAPRVSALLCGRDQVVGVRYPARAIDRLERDGVPVERLVFADATHAFDDDSANDPRAKHRPDLVEQAQAWYAQQLRSAFAP
jgi:dienelactone hydrolase